MATIADALAQAKARHQARDLPSAEALYRQVLQADPSCAEAHYLLGLLLSDRGQLDAAIACHREAARLRGDSAAAHNALGLALEKRGDHQAALACFREAAGLQPTFAAAHNNQGNALKALGRRVEAAACFDRALRLDPTSAEAHNSLGALLQENQQFDEAFLAYERALQLDPNFADAHNNIGQLLCERGEFAAALPRFDQACRLQPERASIRQNRAVTLLTLGDFAAGWPEYEWRSKLDGASPRPPQPEWDGAPLAGRTILLYPEQGRGDAFQFIRYAPLVKQRGGTVVVACPQSLVPILSTCPGIDRLTCQDEPMANFDVQAPLLSLPRIFQTSLATVPANVPYLAADPRLLELWKERLARFEGLKVGLNWQGNRGYALDRYRSIALAQFEPLAWVQGVHFFSLQKGDGTDQLAAMARGMEIHDLGDQLDQQGGAFMDTAAVMMNLDLVITSDTAIPHLAGALGAPVWMALPKAPDWRWLLDRSDSPWYPTMRLFRQSRLQDWTEVFQQIAAELSLLSSARRR